MVAFIFIGFLRDRYHRKKQIRSIKIATEYFIGKSQEEMNF